jgi:glycine cleavage system H protein
MEEIHYSKDHVWARLESDNRVTIGISDFAQQDYGEIYSVKLPEEGIELVKDEPFGTLEAASSNWVDLYAPVSGEILEVNCELEESPEIINEDPLQDGWLIRMSVPSMVEFDELLTEEEYEEYLKEEFGREPEEEQEEDIVDEEEDEDEFDDE